MRREKKDGSENVRYLKYGLHALRTTLCAVNDRISQASVTSTKSSSSRKCRNDDKIELWKSFHLRAYCCSDGDGDTARSIFVVVVLLFSVVCNNVDSVISLLIAIKPKRYLLFSYPNRSSILAFVVCVCNHTLTCTRSTTAVSFVCWFSFTNFRSTNRFGVFFVLFLLFVFLWNCTTI